MSDLYKQHEYYSLQQVQNDVDNIAAQIKADGGIDIIVALSRGGLVPGTILSYKIDKPLIPVRYSVRDDHIRDTSDIVCSYIENGKKVLILDDIIDSGGTIRTFKQDHWFLLRSRYIKHYSIQESSDITTEYFNSSLRVASLIYNSSIPNLVVDYYGTIIDRNKDKQYFDFFWEVDNK